MLALAGELNERMFGPSARPDLPAGIEGKIGLGARCQAATDRNRRSIYVFAKRNLRYPLFDIFDLPDMHNSCAAARRDHHGAAGAGAAQRRVHAWSRPGIGAGGCWPSIRPTTTALVRTAIAEAFARPAGDDELRRPTRVHGSPADRRGQKGGSATRERACRFRCPSGIDPARAAAIVDFCHALLNANEFLYLD